MISKNSRFRIVCMGVVSLTFTACMDLASNEARHKRISAQHIAYHKGEVYTMRGLGGVFSTGMNRLENQLDEQDHVRTASTIWYKAQGLSEYIIAHYKKGDLKGPIILIGHSLGANEQIKVAQFLDRAHIPVDLLMTIDAVSPVRVPPNVKMAYNLYKPGYVPMFSGLKLKAVDPKATLIENVDVATLPNVQVNHFTIDKANGIQSIMRDKVLAVIHQPSHKSA